MERVLRISVIFSLLFAMLGILNSMNFSTTTIKTSKKLVESSNFPLEFSAKVSFSSENSENSEQSSENSGESPLDFSASVKITEEKLVFFRSFGLYDLFSELKYDDFSEIFGKIDGIWWLIDLWDEEISEKLGEETVDFFRNFVEDFDEYEKSELKTIEKFYKEDGISIKITLNFSESPFELPEEYSDFANFFVETFEIN